LEVQADDAEALDITGEAETNGDKGDRNRKGGRGVVKNKGLEKKDIIIIFTYYLKLFYQTFHQNCISF